jgi:hypothetical protein
MSLKVIVVVKKHGSPQAIFARVLCVSVRVYVDSLSLLLFLVPLLVATCHRTNMEYTSVAVATRCYAEKTASGSSSRKKMMSYFWPRQ